MSLNKNDYLTLSGVARSLGVSRWTVYNLIKRGKLSAGEKELGGGHVFPIAEIEALKQTDWFTNNSHLRKHNAPH